jgi:hypothetical protein
MFTQLSSIVQEIIRPIAVDIRRSVLLALVFFAPRDLLSQPLRHYIYIADENKSQSGWFGSDRVKYSQKIMLDRICLTLVELNQKDVGGHCPPYKIQENFLVPLKKGNLPFRS